MNIPVKIVDTTLRDGEQSAGVMFTEKEKIKIVKLLDEIGVEWIEAGIPALGSEEEATLKKLFDLQLSKSKLIAWNRANCDDVLKSINCGFEYIHISVPISDLHLKVKLNTSREEIFKRFEDAVCFAQKSSCIVFAGAEDASRATTEEFINFANFASELGVKRIRYADTIGCLEPFTIHSKFKKIVNDSPIPIEFHGHNDFGLATANALAACQSGVEFVSTTINGIGERAGNACFESVVGSLESLYGYNEYKGKDNIIKKLNKYVKDIVDCCHK